MWKTQETFCKAFHLTMLTIVNHSLDWMGSSRTLSLCKVNSVGCSQMTTVHLTCIDSRVLDDRNQPGLTSPSVSVSFTSVSPCDLWPVRSLTSFQLTSPRTHLTTSSKVPGTNGPNTASCVTQWTPPPPPPPPPQTHQTPIMTQVPQYVAAVDVWLTLSLILPLLLLSPFKSTHLTKWKQQQKHKQKPPPSAGTHSQTWQSN